MCVFHYAELNQYRIIDVLPIHFWLNIQHLNGKTFIATAIDMDITFFPIDVQLLYYA